jgi:hypothetical protein
LIVGRAPSYSRTVSLADLSQPWNGIDRRLAPRFPVALAIILDGFEGWTRDVSTTGIFFFTTQHLLAAGAPITFTLEMNHAIPGGTLQVICAGMILRVERNVDGIGVAASITSYELTGECAERNCALSSRADTSGSNIQLARDTGVSGS